ncbi:MAG: hypothetical protein CMO55_06480 [Verrucomicrobiales bacterium]|nr:hypothetical protein [Verrucomicrobiales bacterium]|tara:strand:- start:147 stop:344 length:198 start_codon:yes stop_codon:yes gene_type:complete
MVDLLINLQVSHQMTLHRSLILACVPEFYYYSETSYAHSQNISHLGLIGIPLRMSHYSFVPTLSS